MMRLTTVGRRTGQPRVAIVGYYEDGENLVTLAMNGWADAEPAWWLNLQAQPDTTVELPDGPRAVRARAAAGAEREQLWARFRDYPGWGDDITALAARRSTETAVVVLEPVPGVYAAAHDHRVEAIENGHSLRRLDLRFDAFLGERHGDRLSDLFRASVP